MNNRATTFLLEGTDGHLIKTPRETGGHLTKPLEGKGGHLTETVNMTTIGVMTTDHITFQM